MFKGVLFKMLMSRRNKVRKPGICRLSCEPLEERSLLAVDLEASPYFTSLIDEAGNQIDRDFFLPGDRIRTAMRIDNAGDSPNTSPFDVAFHLKNNAGASTLLGTVQVVDSIVGGDYRMVSLTTTLPAFGHSIYNLNADYHIVSIADRNNNITESNESNNTSDWQFPPQQLPFRPFLPDFAVRNITISTGPVIGERQIFASLTYEFQNLSPYHGSSTNVPAVYVKFYLSTDSTISKDDFYLPGGYVVNVGGINGNSSVSVTVDDLQLPYYDDPFWDSSDRFYIGAIVDEYGDAAESNESNNSNRGIGIDVIEVFKADKSIPLAYLPSTGMRRGVVLAAFVEQLKNAIYSAAAEQNDMRLLLRRFGKIPTSERELKSLAANVNAIANKLKPLISGRATSVAIARGVTADVNDLDLLEKTIWYVFQDTAGSVAAAALADSQVSIAAGDGLMELIPGYQTYKETKQWVEDKKKQIVKVWDAITSAPSKAFKLLSGVLGGAATTQAAAKQQAQAVQEAGPDLEQRMQEMKREDAAAEKAFLDSLLTGAPGPYGVAAEKLEQIMLKYDASRAELQDDVIRLGGYLENEAVLGFWEGDVSRDGLSGDITIYFQPSTNVPGVNVKGTLGHTFYDEGGVRARTTGSFSGNMINGVFQGTATVRNRTGSGTFAIAWTYRDGVLGGTLYEGQTIMFNTTLKRR